jgi:hypothetical protein
MSQKLEMGREKNSLGADSLLHQFLDLVETRDLGGARRTLLDVLELLLDRSPYVLRDSAGGRVSKLGSKPAPTSLIQRHQLDGCLRQ